MLSSCATQRNPYAQFYKYATTDITGEKLVKVLRPKEECRVVDGRDMRSDTRELVEKGFALIGGAEFESPEVPNVYAEIHGKAIGADIVVIYKNFAGTFHGVAPIVIPGQQTSTTNLNGGYYGTSGSGSIYGQSTTTQNTQTVLNLPYSVNRFSYYGSFWAKPYNGRIFGCDFPDPGDEGGSGLLIKRVDPGSPAERAGVKAGDRIIQINQFEVTSSDFFQKEITKKSGENANVRILRGHEKIWLNVNVP